MSDDYQQAQCRIFLWCRSVEVLPRPHLGILASFGLVWRQHYALMKVRGGRCWRDGRQRPKFEYERHHRQALLR
ncbi:hypothetical protein MGSAQ_001375 [marine sediment metagenome]|uniref:Uncharacterized protein n=1 Tax=marine sediment metagenome TaxID=412755 RepID=A0A1B6NUI9_9ZZZZ